MSLSPGSQLGRYEIVEPLGAGGMGEVYLARDTGLDRQVAIKVLPERFAAEPERLARFEQEARAAAQLNHPHIAAVHDVGAEGQGDERLHYMVQEYLQGRTLREALAAGPLPLRRALEIGLEVAEALRAAHAAGIVHRDLKPDNVFVTEDDHAKVLDFGLAKLTELEGGAPGSESMSPTVLGTQAGAETQAGAIMGTAGYMAPEQAQGEEVDHRADLFALGCLLYEMSTGTQPFPGDNVHESIGRIVSKEPKPVRELDPKLPADLERVVRRCLVKDRSRRCQTAGDLAADLRLLLADVEAGTAVQEPGPEAREEAVAAGLGWVGAAVLVLAVAAIGVLAGWALTRSEPPPQRVRTFTIDFPEGIWARDRWDRLIAISPEGDRVAFVGGGGQLWMQASDERDAIRLPVDDEARTVFFSPDGEQIGYWADDRIMRLEVGSGAPIEVGPHPGLPLGARWESDGFIYAGSQESGIVRIPAAGGQPEVVIAREQDEYMHGPQLLPGGEWILFTLTEELGRWDEASIVAQRVFDEDRLVLVETGRDGRVLSTGHLLYGLGSDLIARPFDLERMEPLGSPTSLVQQVSRAGDVLGRIHSGAMHYDVSDRGDLIYVPDRPSRISLQQPVWASAEGDEPLPLDAGHFHFFDLSPDGDKIAIEVRRTTASEPHVWVFDVDRRGGQRIAAGMESGSPVWSPDGEWIYFRSRGDEGSGIWRQRADLSAEPEPVLSGTSTWQIPASFFTFSISANGALLAFKAQSDSGEGTDIGLLPLESGGEPEVLTTPAQESLPSLSPDGRYVAFTLLTTDGPQVHVLDLETGSRSRISTASGAYPIWTQDGSKIFYYDYAAGFRVSRVDVTTEPELAFSAPEAVSRSDDQPRAFSFDVTADGSRILRMRVVEEEEGADEDDGDRIFGVHNWFTELRERVPR